MARLYKEYAQQNESYLKETDKDIIRYISDCKDGEYTKILQEDERWEVFYHLDTMRTALFSWYDFPENAALLEIGGGFGALTGLFCDKCAHVVTVEKSTKRAEAIYMRYKKRENLEVYAGDIREIQKNGFEQQFDYIILTGVLEKICHGSDYLDYYTDIFRFCKLLLKPDGKIMAAVNNKYGIRNFCGALDEYSRLPFTSLNNYPQNYGGRTFSKKELDLMIKEAGFAYSRYYYPLPDYKLPQVICGEHYEVGSNIRERIIPYYVANDPLIAYENDFYADIIEEGALGFFANSYLVEISRNELSSGIVYATLTTDRGAEDGFITIIKENGVVEKKALFPEGKKHLIDCYENIMDIRRHGVPTVEHRLLDDKLIMPYVNEAPLSNALEQIIHNRDKFIGIFDKLYENAMQSSEHVPAEKNCLLTEENKNLDWGIILKRAYIDMVPFNCFLSEGEILYFDQEFMRENYPARYVIFRALLYTYYFIPEAEKTVPLQEMKQRYTLGGIWDILVEEENRFTARNRNKDLYKNFYRWAEIDRSKFRTRAEILKKTSEKKSTEEARLPKPQGNPVIDVEKDLLRYFIRICEENNLRYFLIYGSLLGTVRHRGMIPWDDDIDVAMPREDYNKLLRIEQKVIRFPYYLQTPEKDKEMFYGGYAKLRNSLTTAIQQDDWGHLGNSGIWMDVFPVDRYDENRFRRNRQLKRVRVLQRLIFAKTYQKEYKGKEFRDVSARKWKFYRIAARCIKRKWLCRRLDLELQRGNQYKSGYVAILARYLKPDAYKFWRAEWSEETERVSYEDMQVWIPRGYDPILQMLYGKKYMEIPPEEKRISHHHVFFSADTPYLIYYRRLYKIPFRTMKGKTVVLWGKGTVLKEFLEKYEKKCRIEFIVDNDRAVWGSLVSGYIMKNPEELKQMQGKKLVVIVCSEYYAQIERQLKEMNLQEYYIYADKSLFVG